MKLRALGQALWQRFRRRLLDQDMYLRLFALAAAVVLWLTAGSEGHLTARERVMVVPVNVRDASQEWELTQEPDPVRVRIRALGPLMDLAERDIAAYVEIGDPAVGVGNYRVEVDAPAGVEVVSVTPNWLRIQVEPVLEKEYPVSLAFLGFPDLASIHEIMPEPAYVVVRARESLLAEVFQVAAYIPHDAAEGLLQRTFALRALDSRGRSLDEVVIVPDEVQLRFRNRY